MRRRVLYRLSDGGGSIGGRSLSSLVGAVPPESGLLADDGRRSTAARFAGDLRDDQLFSSHTARLRRQAGGAESRFGVERAGHPNRVSGGGRCSRSGYRSQSARVRRPPSSRTGTSTRSRSARQKSAFQPGSRLKRRACRRLSSTISVL